MLFWLYSKGSEVASEEAKCHKYNRKILNNLMKFAYLTRRTTFSNPPKQRFKLQVIIIFAVSAWLLLFIESSAMDRKDNMTNESHRVIRKVFGAGRWFPSDSVALRSMVNEYINSAVVEKIDGRIIGAIAPHAGYIYSGKVAGYTFRAIKENIKAGYRPETVVILGFSHRGGFPGVALMDGDGIKTPLGLARLDEDFGRKMVEQHQRIFFDYRPHIGEHSAENLIPFIQSILPDTKIVVGLIGDHDPQTRHTLVSVLEELSKKTKILTLASSDMLHDPDYHHVTQTDKRTLQKVSTMDHKTLQKEWNLSKQIFCGIEPVLLVMQMAELQGCKQGKVLHYRNSGDDYPEGRGRWVVGYSSVVFVVQK